MAAREHGYQRVAAELRRQILAGALTAGERIPSRAQLAQRYDVSPILAAQAVALLKAEGLIDTRPGSGAYVRLRGRVRRLTDERYGQAESPFACDAAAAGVVPGWDCTSHRTGATVEAAARLGVEAGAPCMRSTYVFHADGEPVQLSTSWEPLSLTEGTPVLLPERGPLAGRGVIARMAEIGLYVTHVNEEVSARVPTVAEATSLQMAASLPVLVVERTHYVEQTAVETATLVLPSDRTRIAHHITL